MSFEWTWTVDTVSFPEQGLMANCGHNGVFGAVKGQAPPGAATPLRQFAAELDVFVSVICSSGALRATRN
jgi:hypothetical protein